MSDIRARLAMQTSALKAEQAALRAASGQGRSSGSNGAQESAIAGQGRTRVENYMQDDARDRQSRQSQLQYDSDLRQRAEAPHQPDINPKSRAMAKANIHQEMAVEDRLLAAGRATQASLHHQRQTQHPTDSTSAVPDGVVPATGDDSGGHILRSGQAASRGERDHVDGSDHAAAQSKKQDEFVQRSRQWQERREENIRQQSQRLESDRLAELQEAPRIDRTSNEIARRQQLAASAVGVQPVSAGDRLYAEAELRKQASADRADRMHREQVPGNPAITRKAAELHREGPVGDRLYQQAMESDRRRKLVQAQELRRLEEDARGGGLERSLAQLGRNDPTRDQYHQQHDMDSDTGMDVDPSAGGGMAGMASPGGRSGRRRRGSIEAGRDLHALAYESKRRLELQREIEAEECRENACPRLNRKSLEIANTTPMLDRLQRPTASYAIKRRALQSGGGGAGGSTPVRALRGKRVVGFGSSTPRQVQLASPGSAALVVPRDSVGRLMPGASMANTTTADVSLKYHLIELTKQGKLGGASPPASTGRGASARASADGSGSVHAQGVTTRTETGSGGLDQTAHSTAPLGGAAAEASSSESKSPGGSVGTVPAPVPDQHSPMEATEVAPGQVGGHPADSTSSSRAGSGEMRATNGMELDALGRIAVTAAAILREEEKELTFHPVVKKHSRDIARKLAQAGTAVEVRLSHAGRRHEEDLARLKVERQREVLKECTFQPNQARRSREKKARRGSMGKASTGGAATAAASRAEGAGAAAFRAVLAGGGGGLGSGDGTGHRTSLLRSSRREADSVSASKTPSSMYAKAVEWKEARERRLQMLRAEKQDVDLVGCTFQPNQRRATGSGNGGRGRSGSGGSMGSVGSAGGRQSRKRTRRASYAGGGGIPGLSGTRTSGRVTRRRASIGGLPSELDAAAAADGEGVDMLTLSRPGVEDFFRRKARAHAIEEERAEKASRHTTGRGWTGRTTVGRAPMLGRQRGPGVASLRRPVDYDAAAASTYARGAVAREQAQREAAITGVPVYSAQQSPLRGMFDATLTSEGGSFVQHVRTDKERRHGALEAARRQEEDNRFHATVERLAEEALARQRNKSQSQGQSQGQNQGQVRQVGADEMVRETRGAGEGQQSRDTSTDLQSDQAGPVGQFQGGRKPPMLEEDMKVELRMRQEEGNSEHDDRRIDISVAARAALGASMRKQAAAASRANGEGSWQAASPGPARDDDVSRVLRSTREAAPPGAGELLAEAMRSRDSGSASSASSHLAAAAALASSDLELASDQLREAVVRASMGTNLGGQHNSSAQSGITAAQIMSMSAKDRKMLGPSANTSSDELLERMEKAAEASLAATHMQVQEHLRRLREG